MGKNSQKKKKIKKKLPSPSNFKKCFRNDVLNWIILWKLTLKGVIKKMFKDEPTGATELKRKIKAWKSLNEGKSKLQNR